MDLWIGRHYGVRRDWGCQFEGESILLIRTFSRLAGAEAPWWCDDRTTDEALFGELAL